MTIVERTERQPSKGAGLIKEGEELETFARLMLLRGAKPKVISEALGHSSVAFTMDVYSHIIEGMQSDAMALLDEVLPPGKNETKNKINAKLTPTIGNLVPKYGNLASRAASSTGRAADS